MAGKTQYVFKRKVWLYPGMAGWHFVSLSKKESEDIKSRFGTKRKGWGSIPVRVTIRKTKWKTSIFPDTKAGVYLLPLKADVRKKEDIYAGDTVHFSMKID